jgi:glycosyltransferase involved in cell wall biosynthesis
MVGQRFEEQFQPDALILLGYPDQFPFLADAAGLRDGVFLWAQFSRPPATKLERCVVIPLTEKTREFAKQAQIQRVGPVIPHAVDTRVFRPRSENTSWRRRFRLPQGFLIGSLGANTTRKRFDRLIAAFALAQEGMPSGTALVIKTDREKWAGGFDLPKLIRRFGLRGRVHLFTEELDDDTLAGLYGTLDLYVHTAEWEGFGIPIVEAMACGIPVVAPQTQGPAELLPYRDTIVRDCEIVDEDGTKLVHVDPPALAAMMSTVAADEAKRRELAALGRDRAVIRYDVRTVVDLWENVLEN